MYSYLPQPFAILLKPVQFRTALDTPLDTPLDTALDAVSRGANLGGAEQVLSLVIATAWALGARHHFRPDYPSLLFALSYFVGHSSGSNPSPLRAGPRRI
jgi:hypothetical protein